MRVELPGIARAGPPASFAFDGQPVDAYPGESIAAALIAAGEWSFRHARDGTARGPFCGMGVCGECLVTVDGVAKRACLEPVRAGATVARHPVRAAPGEAAAPAGAWRHEACDVLVVGAGPAGLAAARVAAACGADVLVVDERAKAGGQYFKQPGDGFRIDEQALDTQFAEGRRLLAEARAAGARFLFGATVWGAFDADGIALVHEGGTVLVRARRVVLAPGAYERALPVPGWTLPGVITTGAAQTLLRAYQVAPGRRVLVAGHGPLNLQVARELTRAGVEVVAVGELATRPGLRQLGSVLAMARTAPGLVADGVRHTLALRARGVPVLHRHVLLRAEGTLHVERAVLARIDDRGEPLPGSERAFAVDAVCMGYGFLPQSELARALGCAHTFDPSLGSLVVVRDADCRSSLPHVFVAGDAGGLGGARLALVHGTRAGAAAAADLGYAYSDTARALLADAATLDTRHRRFQAALWSLYEAPSLGVRLADGGTLLCRCEHVDRASVEACLRDGAGSLSAVKRLTRAGMGRCQGRYCSGLLAALAHGDDAGLDEGAFFAPRTPFKPVPLAAIAGSKVENTCTQ